MLGSPLLEDKKIAQIIEAALLSADVPLSVDRLMTLFADGELVAEGPRKQVQTALSQLEEDCAQRGIALEKVASGYRFQTRQELAPWVSRLWEEKPPRYTRALLETLALIAYKQPVTRGDIEQVRGVAVSQNIMRTLVERDWIRVVGQRETPGKPSMYGTTKAFLDYFNLAKLDQLPPLEEIKALIEPTLVEEEVQVPEQLEAPDQLEVSDHLEVSDESEVSDHLEVPEQAVASTENQGSPPSEALEPDSDASVHNGASQADTQ